MSSDLICSEILSVIFVCIKPGETQLIVIFFFAYSIAIEYAKKNITINCVSPGFIQTKMTDSISEQIKSELTSRIPMNRLGTGEDVSNTVAFLSSEASSYITGETIHVNGGMYMA